MSLVAFTNKAKQRDLLADQLLHNFEDLGTGTYYIGYLAASGNWHIQKWTGTVMSYAFGTTDYATNWTNRASLTYAAVHP